MLVERNLDSIIAAGGYLIRRAVDDVIEKYTELWEHDLAKRDADRAYREFKHEQEQPQRILSDYMEQLQSSDRLFRTTAQGVEVFQRPLHCDCCYCRSLRAQHPMGLQSLADQQMRAAQQGPSNPFANLGMAGLTGLGFAAAQRPAPDEWLVPRGLS